MTLAFFNELPEQSQISLATTDRGVLSAQMVPGTGIASAYARTLFVALGGNDATADGSLVRPFGSIQAAVDRAAASGAQSTAPFSVLVFPGVYDGFTLAPDVFVEGLSELNVVITGNIFVSAAWQTGTHVGGVGNMTLAATIAPDFSGSTGLQDFFLAKLILVSSASVAITGGNSGLFADLKSIHAKSQTGASSLTLLNVAASSIAGVDLRQGSVTFNATSNAFTQTHQAQSLAANGTFTATSTQTTTNLSVILDGGSAPITPTNISISGARTKVQSRALFQVTGPDAATTFSFGVVPNGGTVILVQGAENTIVANPSAARTYTLEPGGVAGTRLRIVNQSGANAITLAYAGGASGPASTVAANATLELYATAVTVWNLGG